MSKPKATPMKTAIHRECDNPCFGEGVLYVELVDEAAGAFIELSQGEHTVSIDPDELDLFIAEARKLLRGWAE